MKVTETKLRSLVRKAMLEGETIQQYPLISGQKRLEKH